MNKVSFLFLGIPEHFGGAERQFADTYDFYQGKQNNQLELYFITDTKSLKNMRDVNRLKSDKNLIIIPSFETVNKYIRILLWNIYVLNVIFNNKINLLHIGLPNPVYAPLLFVLSKFKRKKIVFNATDCTIAHEFENLKKYHTYKIYMNYIKFDAVFSWYKLFTERFSKGEKLAENKTPIVSAKYCFANLEMFHPNELKSNHIIWAARLVASKRPLMFIEAIKIFKEKYLKSDSNWKFFIYGEGPLKNEIIELIRKYNLQDILELNYSNNLSQIFSKSRLFVSTQDYENFTSLSMLEAMASGNAIISRNVGQSDYFVRNEGNGYLLKEDTAEDMAYMINRYIMLSSEERKNMENMSIDIATNTHNITNFIDELELFWIYVLEDKYKCAE